MLTKESFPFLPLSKTLAFLIKKTNSDAYPDFTHNEDSLLFKDVLYRMLGPDLLCLTVAV